MVVFGIILAAIGFITYVLPSYGVEFFVMEAIAEPLGISQSMLSILLIVIGFAMVVVRIFLGIFRNFRDRVTASGRDREQL
jgi:hypothetical protein